MKKLIVLTLIFLSQVSMASLSTHDVLNRTNAFMRANCRDFDASMPKKMSVAAKQFIVTYKSGWAEIGIKERPPHDDSGKTTDELVVINFSCY